MASISQASYSGANLSGVVPGRSGSASAYSCMRVPSSCSAPAASGGDAALAAASTPFGVGANPVAEARRPVAFPRLKIQFSQRSSNAPLWRTPNCPALLIASTGTIAARLGALVMPMACCVAPEYDVPTVPTLPFDHGCAAIHFSRSAPSGPSSRIGRHVPPDR